MTGEEVVAALDAQSRKLLASKNLPVSDAMVALLNEAKLQAFNLGSNTALSMVKGALLVKLMQCRSNKSKEAGNEEV